MKKLCIFLSLLLLFNTPLSVHADDSTKANLDFYYVQCDDRWKDIYVGDLTIAQSACGIATLCNAVYYLTGVAPDLVEMANWAHDGKLFNAPGVPGCYRSVFYYAGVELGNTYGFVATQNTYGSMHTQEIKDCLLSGGTVAVHVPGHFMAVVDYNPETERFLVIDPMPGDYGRYDNRRKGLTNAGGNWLTADELSVGNIAVDCYVLFTRTLSDAQREAVQIPAQNALIMGIE